MPKNLLIEKISRNANINIIFDYPENVYVNNYNQLSTCCNE